MVIPDGQLFLKMWYYAPERLKSRILFLANESSAVRYMGFDTIDGGLRTLVPWSSAQILDYNEFTTPAREFLAYQTTLRPGRLLSRVLEDGASVEIRSHSSFRDLIRIRLRSGSR